MNIESSAHKKYYYKIAMAFGNEQSNERVKTLLVEEWFKFVAEHCFWRCDNKGGCVMKRIGFSENLCTYETYPSSLIFGFGIEGNEGRVRRRSETRSRWVRCSFDIWVCVDFLWTVLKTEEEREQRSLLWMLLLQNGSVVSMTKREPRKTNPTVDLHF